MGTLLKSKFPDASQGSALQAGLSKDSSLSPVMLIHFAHNDIQRSLLFFILLYIICKTFRLNSLSLGNIVTIKMLENDLNGVSRLNKWVHLLKHLLKNALEVLCVVCADFSNYKSGLSHGTFFLFIPQIKIQY